MASFTRHHKSCGLSTRLHNTRSSNSKLRQSHVQLEKQNLAFIVVIFPAPLLNSSMQVFPSWDTQCNVYTSRLCILERSSSMKFSYSSRLFGSGIGLLSSQQYFYQKQCLCANSAVCFNFWYKSHSPNPELYLECCSGYVLNTCRKGGGSLLMVAATVMQ